MSDAIRKPERADPRAFSNTMSVAEYQQYLRSIGRPAGEVRRVVEATVSNAPLGCASLKVTAVALPGYEDAATRAVLDLMGMTGLHGSVSASGCVISAAGDGR